MDFVRICPACKSSRPVQEMYCQNTINDSTCSWLLMNVMQTLKGGEVEIPKEEIGISTSHCINGHEVEPTDFMCMECGADIQSTTALEQPVVATEIAGYTIVTAVTANRITKECYIVKDEEGKEFFLTWYFENSEPDKAIYNVLEKIDSDHIATLLKTGYYEDRFYEISELILGGSLDKLDYLDETKLERLVDEVGRAINELTAAGLRHRNICPENILIRDSTIFDLVIIDYSSARLSDYDLNMETPLEINNYSAPEAIIGGISPASDWWSLGMIILNQVTRGNFFENINTKAFMIHVITRGVEIPSSISPRILPLLQGLLNRDPLKRWNWEQVEKWLKGEFVQVPLAEVISNNVEQKKIKLGARCYVNIDLFALAAAEEGHWEEGLELFRSGALGSWVSEILGDHKIESTLRDLRYKDDIPLEWRYSLTLMNLNDNLPLTWRGQVIIPAWLLGNVQAATELIESSIPDYLVKLNREKWLINLKERKAAIIRKSKNLGVTLNTDKFLINSLSTSRIKLTSELELLRQLYPDAHNVGLSDIMSNFRTREEDMILLLSADIKQFISLEELLDDLTKLALKSNLKPDISFYKKSLVKDRLVLFENLKTHLSGFSRCSYEKLNHWADQFRIEKRLSLLPSILCLSIPKEQWKTPPKHEYASSLLRHFEKKVIYASSRGPLVRLIISKNSARIDLKEIGTKLKSSERLVEKIIARSTDTETIDPLTFSKNPFLRGRTRRMLLKAANFKRDTGLDSLFMGFPFLVAQHKPTHRPRILPILLWPVKLEYGQGVSPSLKVGFDFAHGEVRLNPALANTINPEDYKKLQILSQEILSRQTLTILEVLNSFSTCFSSISDNLCDHPAVTYKLESMSTELYPSAVIFNANFTGQSISEDLRVLQTLPHAETAIEPILRISERERVVKNSISTEKERYTTMAIDPSQDRAVLKSRNSPGIVIEGPPGTGKSQTIVNIISDCIGRNEKVLVVSQKRAAIQVILKRLQSVKLEKRALLITDLARDRQPIIQGIREQIANYSSDSYDESQIHLLSEKRESLSKQVERIEKELDQLSHQIHIVDELSGISYRSMLSELINSSAKEYIEIPELRQIFENCTRNELNISIEQISSLLEYWLPSNYEHSVLHLLKVTSFDEITKLTIENDLVNFYKLEKLRVNVVSSTTGKLDTAQAPFYEDWLTKNKRLLLNVSDEQASDSSHWKDLMYTTKDQWSIGDQIHKDISQINTKVKELIFDIKNDTFKTYFNDLNENDFSDLKKSTLNYFSATTFLQKINPLYWVYRGRIKRVLNKFNLQFNETQRDKFLAAILTEEKFRTYRSEYFKQLSTLGIQPSQIFDIRLLSANITSVARRLSKAISLVSVLRDCPAKEEARTLLDNEKSLQYREFITDLENARNRYQHRQSSLKQLSELKKWLTSEAVQNFKSSISQNDRSLSLLHAITKDLEHFIPYQEFRVRYQNNRHKETLDEIFSILRKYEEQILKCSRENRESIIEKSLYREGLLAWKQRIEKSYPAILMGDREIQNKLHQLEQYLDELKNSNQSILAANYKYDSIAPQSNWNRITRLRGKNYRKLREFIKEGEPLGLLELRPVWLMNPEVVSQALPLKSGIFDVVIFDEASQMLVDHSIPALYRAKRVIISGDEKQMPPTGFFSTKMEEDDSPLEELDEDHSEEERVQFLDTWNKKEVKDSPDLLSLAKTTLPTTTLQIHYRSEFKALIDYSNYAFYNGLLHVPAYHPIEEIVASKPIEVLRVNGIYDEQSNIQEADTLIHYLAKHWLLPPSQRLSTGIVTFNKKQAELIEEKLAAYALEDPIFQNALALARNTYQDGEDMGFFVKNVENVQGDERDMILFSTTFGLNPLGSFRRNFGALGHQGGERRLNVAITRARKKVVIATSMPIQSISDILSTGRYVSKPRDYIQTYLNYAELHANHHIDLARKSLSTLTSQKISHEGVIKDDGFKNTVKDYVHSLGYETVEDSDDSVFYMDLAIKDQNTGRFVLGIECDTPHMDLLKQARYRELWRPTILKRSIPHIHRTTSYQWLENTENEKIKLNNALEKALNHLK